MDRGSLHDAAIGELDAERGVLADANLHLRELPWLDAFDLSSDRGRSSKIAATAPAAVEKLLATL
jgi:hypothetical protein